MLASPRRTPSLRSLRPSGQFDTIADVHWVAPLSRGTARLFPRARGVHFTLEQQARSSGQLAYAIDLDHPTEGFFANVIVTEEPGQMPDPSKSSSPPDGFMQALAKVYPPGTTFDVVSTNSVSVGRFRGTRILVDAQLPAIALRQLIYLLPLGDEILSLVYTAPRTSYATYEPRFDASALATTGLANPTSPVLSMIPAITSGITMAVVASLLAARKKKKAA